jgi:hypothetical protein
MRIVRAAAVTTSVGMLPPLMEGGKGAGVRPKEKKGKEKPPLVRAGVLQTLEKETKQISYPDGGLRP